MMKDGEYLHEHAKPMNDGSMIQWVGQKLTDGSKIYSILIGNVRINCVDYFEAEDLFYQLLKYDIEID